MTPTLRLHLLGHFHLLVNGEPVPIHQARLHALLAYLFLHRNTPQARQHMAFVFWPDSTEVQARANLRKALYELRQVFPGLEHFVQVESQYLQWQAGTTVDVDVTNFEGSLAQAGEPPTLPAALEQAVALYTGDLLPNCYDDWLLRERERLRQRYLSALEQLIYLLEDRREIRPAIVHAQQLLQADPLHESTYRTLMRLHLQNGDRALALRVYHACTTALQQELGVEAGPETQAAYQRLLNMEVVPATQSAPATPKGELPLVGRQREREALQHVWHMASRGQPHFALIAGEAGIGKTRLAEEVRQWAEQQGHVTAKTRSYAAEGEVAYAPVADWLRSDGMRTRLARLERVWLSEVARLLPELLVERTDLPMPQPLTDSWQRQHFREALARTFVAGEQPLLLVLDDLQWCDRETLEWLHYLLRFAKRAPLLVVGTVRPEEIGAEHPLLTLLMNLRQDGNLLELELGPLNAAETAELAAQVAGYELNAEHSASVYAQTEGYPLFVVEMMRARETDANANLPAHTPSTALPPKVQAMIGARLLQLTPLTRELAELAAVVGRAFTVEVLAYARASDEDALVRGLDELWQRRIIREQGVNAYDFGHDRIREAAYASISPARRRLLHGRVAQALERIHAIDLDGVSGQIAAHYESAGQPEKAILFYQRAGDVAQRVYAHADAVSNLVTGITLLNHLPVTPERLRQELRLQLALGVSWSALLGSPDSKVREVYIRARELALQAGDDAECIASLAGLFVCELTRGEIRTAYELAKQCVSVAQRLGDPSGLVEARGRLGVALQHLGQWRASRDIFEQLLAQQEYRWEPSSGLRWLQHQGLTIRTHLAVVLWHLGYPDQAEKGMNENLALVQELAHPYSLAYHMNWCAWLCYYRREPQLVQQYAERGIVVCQQQGFRYLLTQCIVTEGWALAQQGHVDIGIARMEEALAARLAMNAKLRQPGYLVMLAETYANARQAGHGLNLLNEALAQIDATGERYSEVEVYRWKGELLRMQGASEQEAEACFLQALAIARQQEAKSLELRAAMSLGRLWQQQGKRQQARDLLDEVYGWFSEGFDTLDLIEARSLLESLT
jgi:DNA-binding SARP family transcriptional activator